MGDYEMGPERPKKSISFKVMFWLIVVMVITVVAVLLVKKNYTSIENFFSSKQSEVVQTTDTIVESPPTIQEVLEFRKHVIECQRVDSIFLTMPDVILIDILMQHGTSLSNSDIVTIYESNKSTYNSVMSGARSQQYKDSLEHPRIKKDSIKLL